MKRLFPTKTVTEVTGITAKTLQRYSELGLIEKPIFESMGKKGGACNYWPSSIFYDLSLIKQLKKMGKTMVEIKSTMGDNK